MCKGKFQPFKPIPACELGLKVASILNQAPRAVVSSPLSLPGRCGWRREQMADKLAEGRVQSALVQASCVICFKAGEGAVSEATPMARS